ncbi:phage tail protein [uncultured Shewanella sp.]|uniref:phage tail-collar fiber domain-containing protein n=1 Tax=uncultured Shewanella sp. TaxID=173975 RepID=UPI00260BD021|nr:phage tail protein [uncultured Shewanella sp.]
MSQLVITNSGIDYKNAVFAGDEVQNITHFVFAYIPELDPDLPIDPDSTIDASHIVASHPIERVSKLNGNAVIMSTVLDYSVGDFTYNAYGVMATKTNGDEVLIAIVHTSSQTKTKTVGAVTGNYSVKSIVWRGVSVAGELNVTLSTLPWQVSDSEFLRSDDFAAHLSHANPHSQYVLNNDVPSIMKGTITSPIYLADINIKSPPLAPGFYYQTASAAAKFERGYPITRAGSLEVTKATSQGVVYTYKEYDSGETYVCGLYNDVWTDWQRLFDTSKPPTASQVGAVSLSGTAANASKLEGKAKAQVVSEARSGLLTTSGTAANSNKLDNKTRAQLVAEARSGLLTTSGTAANASKLENKTKAQVVAEAKAGLIPSTSGNQVFSGRLVASAREGGMYGVYDSTKTQNIWSMGERYRVASDGANFGSLYGLAYKHTNNLTGGTMAGGHQMVWCENGTPKSAIGLHLWTNGNVYEKGEILSSRYLAKTARASDTSKFLGYGLSSSSTANTAVLRNGSGNVLAHSFYEDGVSLAGKYLGKTARASDTSKFLGYGLSSDHSANTVVLRSINGNIYAKTLYENNVSLTNKYLGKTARASDTSKFLGYGLSSDHGANTVVLRSINGNVYAKALYENNISLKNKYLEKTARAQDSYKLGGLTPTSGATPSTIMIRNSSGDSALRKLTSEYQDFSRNTETFNHSTLEAGNLMFRAYGSLALRVMKISDFVDYLISVLPTNSGGTGGGSGGGGGGGGCFALGTKVLLANGQETAMETLKVGDAIRAFSHPVLATGRNDESWRLASSINLDGSLLSTAIVKHVMLNSYDNYYLINNSLEVTYEHPLLTYSPRFNDWRWLAAEHIQVGDNILTEAGEMMKIESHVFIDAPLNTVNIDVEELDNYFVKLREHWLLAHNSNKD